MPGRFLAVLPETGILCFVTEFTERYACLYQFNLERSNKFASVWQPLIQRAGYIVLNSIDNCKYCVYFVFNYSQLILLVLLEVPSLSDAFYASSPPVCLLPHCFVTVGLLCGMLVGGVVVAKKVLFSLCRYFCMHSVQNWINCYIKAWTV
jgi:hypothetical protein